MAVLMSVDCQEIVHLVKKGVIVWQEKTVSLSDECGRQLPILYEFIISSLMRLESVKMFPIIME